MVVGLIWAQIGGVWPWVFTLQPWVGGEDRFSAMGLREEEQESYGDSAMATHLFLICHGRATPSLISSAYSFACGPIFLSFLILQNFVPLVLGFFVFVFTRGCGVV